MPTYLPTWVLIIAAALVAWPAMGWLAMHQLSGWARRLVLLLAFAIALSIAWVVPADLPWLRFMLLVPSFIVAGKAIDLMVGPLEHPEVLETPGHFLIWAMMLPTAHRPEDPDQRQALRAEAGPVALRGVLKAGASVGMLALNSAVPLHDNLWISTFWMMFLLYFVFSGGADLLSLPTRLAGVQLAPMFDAPVLARSPRDFWSRRWNLWFSDMAHRRIFQPLGGARRPVIAVSAVFVFSALLHEYMVWVSLGAPDGRMTAFFLIHGAGTIVTVTGARALKRKTLMPRALAIPLHIVWFTLTAPLFFGPVNEAFTFHLWRLW